MFDSRTHKPVLPGTHRYGTEKSNCTYWCCDDRPANRSVAKREAIVEALADLDPDSPAATSRLDRMDRPFTRHEAFISPIGHGGEYGHRAECATCGTVLDLHTDLESAFASVNQHVEWSLNPVLSPAEAARLYDEAVLEDMERSDRLEEEWAIYEAIEQEQYEQSYSEWAERDDHEGEPWIEYVGSIEACREVFGGRDFIVIHADRPRL